GGARRDTRDSDLLLVPTLLPARRDRRGTEGLNVGDLVNIGFDLDGVLMRNPFETCVLPRLEALLSSAPGIQALDEETGGNAVRSRVGAGWRSRMATGDLASAYDWDAVYRQVAGELGADAESLADIDVAAWVRECCGDDGHIAALPGAPELLRALEEAGHRLVVISNG